MKINAGHPRSLTQPFAGSYKKCGGEYIDLRQTEIDTFNNSTAWMSALGHWRTFRSAIAMSALPQ
ncbi:MAG: hypothetical protein WB474_12860 [Nitrososphaeraceae archaeon]